MSANVDTLKFVIGDRSCQEPSCIRASFESAIEQVNVVGNDAVAIDLGLNNLATVVSSTSESFIIDGLWLKSKNQWFNKRRAKLISHKDKQGIKHLTKKEAWLSYRRKNQVNNYLNQAARYIVNFCLSRKISKHKGFSRVSRVCLTQPVRVNVLRDSCFLSSI